MASGDRIKETTTSTGTGNLTLLGAATGFKTLGSFFTPAQSSITLAISNDSGTEWEISKCTYINATTVSRDTVISSSNSDALVNFSAGTKTVVHTLSADDVAKFISTLAASATSVASQATSKLLMVESGVAKQITVNDFLASVGQTVGGLTVAGTLAGANIITISQDGGATEVRTTLSALAAYVASTLGATVPGAPTIGTATAGTANASVAFTAPASNGGSAITGYTATSSPGGFTGTGASSPITVSGLSNGTSYTFTVTATNSVGTGSASAASNSVTPSAGATAPGAPTIGTATAGNTTASVTFTAPANNGGSAITGYTVTSSPGGLTGTGASSPITVNGLTNGTAYTFTVTATNAIGTGAASASSNSVTPAVGNPYKVNLLSSSPTLAVSVTASGTGSGASYIANPVGYYVVKKTDNTNPVQATIQAGTGVRSAIIITTTDVAPTSPTFLGDTTAANGYWHTTTAGTFPNYNETSFIWRPAGATPGQTYYAWLYVRTGDNYIHPVWNNGGTTQQRIAVTITA